ncbi:dephospho-CoA kinase [Massilia sp. PAMC28688]|uniref:dephospho-CoA kinase n=1 Tax=Massilia sp. PAMC28688 TaxID=2861283 RepID=UPI001C62DE43|nr:dephospho-CoA kinase [Massilia sp. PAMC28688]QYF94352.1 dephospho-CoA kinase [Massilia sp. PAMC28688]
MDSARPRFSVGLTGGIGCGKTTVANMFGALGATLVDTDEIAHALTAPGGAAMAAIDSEFGREFLTPEGALNRPRMRALVFSDPGAKARLEAILHPRIRDAALAQAAIASGSYVIFVVPLLIESGTWRQRVTRVLAIDCDEAVQVARVMTRNGLTEEQVRAIMATQVTRQERLAAADDVITNNGAKALLEPQITRLHAQYLAFSERMSRLPVERL